MTGRREPHICNYLPICMHMHVSKIQNRKGKQQAAKELTETNFYDTSSTSKNRKSPKKT